MAKVCDICGKQALKGHNISHAHNVTNRRWLPNLHKTRVMIGKSIKTVKICARCLRSGKVQKVV
jgi:large subunit ribosomal protein L28